MNGCRYATAFFITRADFTTCGKNILPAPNKSPTTFMPAISGPSMTASGLPYFCRASSVSCFDVIHDALHERVLEAFLNGAFAPLLFCATDEADAKNLLFDDSANLISRSVASGRRFSRTSSTQFQQILGNLVIHRKLPGVDDAHVQPGTNGVKKKRAVHRLAHHIVAAERKRNVADAAADFRAAEGFP